MPSPGLKGVTPCIPILLLTVHSRDRSRNCRSPFMGRFPVSASPLRSRLANASGRIEFIIVLFMDWSFASGRSPPRLSTRQLPSATDRPVFPSDRDFHPTVGAYSQAHFSCPFGARDSPRTFLSLPPFRHVTDSSNAAGRYEINGRRKIDHASFVICRVRYVQKIRLRPSCRNLET
jgi:hypothetical protein